MIPLSFLPLMLMLASPTLDARSEKVIDLFVQVCLKGEARFARDDIDPVNSGSMPWPMSGLTFNRQGQFYQVRRPVGAWIAVTDGGDDARSYSRICRVSAKYVDVRAAADRIRAYLREPSLPRGQRLGHYEEYYLGGGAKFEISRARHIDLVILQSYTLTPEAAARARRKLEP
jgi:hypothetical protein